MPDDLYDRDVLVWSEQQAALLRRLAAGEQPNGPIDWPHIIEELEDVGLSELRACESLLRQAMLHLLKAYIAPAGPVEHWRSETIGFMADAQARFTPSMRQRIDLAVLYARARKQALASLKPTEQAPELPDLCPWTLDELLSDDANPADLAHKLG